MSNRKALAAIVTAFAALSCRSFAHAAVTGDQHPSYMFASTGETMPYHLYVPVRYRPDRPMPLVVLLHGGGRDEESEFKSANFADLAERHGFIVLAVHGYSPTGGYGDTYPIVVTKATIALSEAAPQPRTPLQRAPFFSLGKAVSVPVPLDDYGELPPGQLIDPHIGELSAQETLAAIARVRADYAVDPRRIYLGGNSMGGVGTLYLAAKYPRMWAAIAPGAGALAAWSYPYQNLKDAGVAALFVHGALDEHANPHWSQLMAEEAKRYGVDATFLGVPGKSHSVAWASVTPQIFDFFDRHRRATDAPALAEDARATPGPPR